MMRIFWILTGALALVAGPGCRKAPAPVPSTVLPASGPEAGGTLVTLTGSNFMPGMAVRFGASNAATVNFSNVSLVTVVAPKHPAGAVPVTVENPDRQAATLVSAFTFELPPQPVVLVEWHFVGGEAVQGSTNATQLKAIIARPESQTLLNQTLDKLARAPFARLASRLAGRTNDCAGLLRPLFQDLTTAESFLQIRTLPGGTPEWALAVRLPAERAVVWRTNLADALAGWIGEPPAETSQERGPGWRLMKHDPPSLVGFAEVGGWTLLGAGQDGLSLQDELAKRIKADGRPVAAASDYWLRAVVDWPKLRGLPAVLAALRLPKTELTAVGEGDHLQTRVDMLFPQPHGWHPEPWLFPTNIIREPVVSFTAVQGFAKRLKPFARALGLNPDLVPNQACFWGLADIPFQTYVAAPVPDATSTMATLCELLPQWFSTNAQGLALGSWRATTNNRAILWDGMPFFGGFLRMVPEETDTGFLFAGLFPNSTKPVSPPPELFYQLLGRTNLAYYDWEIGGERLLATRGITQLALMLAEKPQLSAQSAAYRWVDMVSTNLGNIGTSVTVTGPDRMVLARQSPYGFTGVETVLLANWLESQTFPWGYELHRPPKKKATAAAAAQNP